MGANEATGTLRHAENLFDIILVKKKSSDPAYFPLSNMLVPCAYSLFRNQRPWQLVQLT